MHYLVLKNGYGFFEAASAFQKSIRRGDEKVAIYFTVEFFNSGYDEYLWRKLKVICSEDIGLAEPDMMVRLDVLYKFYSEKKKESATNSKNGKNSKGERMFLIHAVLMLVRAKKSRLVDYVMISSWREHDTLKMEIPDYAHDMHTAKGKAKGRGAEHFFKEGAFCENHAKQPGEDEAKASAERWWKLNPGPLNFSKVASARTNEMTFGDEEL